MNTQPKPTGEQNIIERLRYIADSPSREHGGFHEQAIQTAKDAIAALAAEREKSEGALHHMEACRSLLNVPSDEVLYEAIQQLREQLAAAQVAMDLADKREVELLDAAIAEATTKLACELAAEREKVKQP